MRSCSWWLLSYGLKAEPRNLEIPTGRHPGARLCALFLPHPAPDGIRFLIGA